MEEKCQEGNCELSRCCRKNNNFMPGIEIIGSQKRKEAIENGVGSFLCHNLQLTSGECGMKSFLNQLKTSNATLEHNAKKIKDCYGLYP